VVSKADGLFLINDDLRSALAVVNHHENPAALSFIHNHDPSRVVTVIFNHKILVTFVAGSSIAEVANYDTFEIFRFIV
jgi:hypothetical protein